MDKDKLTTLNPMRKAETALKSPIYWKLSIYPTQYQPLKQGQLKANRDKTEAHNPTGQPEQG